MSVSRVRCAAKACRRNIRTIEFEQEWPRADAWAQVFSAGNPTLYLCPLHRLELEEQGEVTKSNPKSNPENRP